MGGKDARLACGSLLEAPLRRGLRELSQHAIRSDAPSLCDRQRRRLIFQANLLIFSASLDEAFKLAGVWLGSGGRPRSPTPKRNEPRSHMRRRIARTL